MTVEPEKEAAYGGAAGPPRGWWSAEPGTDVSAETWDRIKDEVRRATDEGLTMVVADGITLTWHDGEPRTDAYVDLLADSIEGAFLEATGSVPPLLRSELLDIAFGLSAAIVTGQPLTVERVVGAADSGEGGS